MYEGDRLHKSDVLPIVIQNLLVAVERAVRCFLVQLGL